MQPCLAWNWNLQLSYLCLWSVGSTGNSAWPSFCFVLFPYLFSWQGFTLKFWLNLYSLQSSEAGSTGMCCFNVTPQRDGFNSHSTTCRNAVTVYLYRGNTRPRKKMNSCSFRGHKQNRMWLWNMGYSRLHLFLTNHQWKEELGWRWISGSHLLQSRKPNQGWARWLQAWWPELSTEPARWKERAHSKSFSLTHMCTDTCTGKIF